IIQGGKKISVSMMVARAITTTPPSQADASVYSSNGPCDHYAVTALTLLAIQRHRPFISINHHTLTTFQPLSGYTGPQHSRNVILTGHNRTVAEWTSHVGHDPRGQGEERCPGRCCDPCHQNITLTH